MLEPPVPADEETRLALLKACRIMYTPTEEAFDDVARLAADLCGTEIALITLVDVDYQWFKARVGVERTGTSRDLSFCGHCINHQHALVVEDTHLDPRFADNPLVTGDPFIRFYAGVPLLVDEGSAIGALSVADRMPRSITARQIESLARLAKQVSRELRLRRDVQAADARSTPRPHRSRHGRRRTMAHHARDRARRDGRGVRSARRTRRSRRDPSPPDVALERRRRRTLRARRRAVLMRLKSNHVGKLLDVGNLDPAQVRCRISRSNISKERISIMSSKRTVASPFAKPSRGARTAAKRSRKRTGSAWFIAISNRRTSFSRAAMRPQRPSRRSSTSESPVAIR